MAERLSNLGYLGLIKESVKGTPLTPTTYVPLYKDSFTTDIKADENNPIVGVKAMIYQMFMGQRTHAGTLEVMAEPNTAEYFLDMLLANAGVTGGGPYTHSFTLSPTTNPNSYTIDLQKGQVVHRFWGVEADTLDPSWDKDMMRFSIGAAALGSFTVRQIATVATTTLTLDTAYDVAAPNKGLVVGDLVRIMSASNFATTLDTTIASVNADGITVTLGASAAAYAPGDFIFLRAGTPAYTMKTPFLWGRTEFRFGANASAALSAAQTNVENGSKWKITHNFESKDGAHRSGSFDPIALVRTQGTMDLNVKRFYDTPEDLSRFLRINGQACVIRHFSETGYELRLTLNNIMAKTNKTPLETGKILYQEYDFQSVYSTGDGQAFDAKVINNLAT